MTLLISKQKLKEVVTPKP